MYLIMTGPSTKAALIVLAALVLLNVVAAGDADKRQDEAKRQEMKYNMYSFANSIALDTNLNVDIPNAFVVPSVTAKVIKNVAHHLSGFVRDSLRRPDARLQFELQFIYHVKKSCETIGRLEKGDKRLKAYQPDEWRRLIKVCGYILEHGSAFKSNVYTKIRSINNCA